MPRADGPEVLAIAREALGRYKLRTSLSVIGVVCGVASVIAMMSVTEGAAREALSQVEALGLDNVVARGRTPSAFPGSARRLRAGDLERLQGLVPLAVAGSPLVERYVRASYNGQSEMIRVVGVVPAFQQILRLVLERGRFLATLDEQRSARVCVLGRSLARRLFGYRDPIGESIRLGSDHCRVVGILTEPGDPASTAGTFAWRDLARSALVPLPVVTGRTIAIAPGQPVDEIWLQAGDGRRVEALAGMVDRVLTGTDEATRFVDIVVPRELLAQRYRTQRTFSIVVGSVAVLALLIGGIGIMNIMLTSVVERTTEIGLRRTVGATQRAILLQFLTETLLMTVSGGMAGISLGILASWGITRFAGWSTRVSPLAIGLAFLVSFVVGVVFGLYPAVKAARLEPVQALHHE